MTLAIAWLATFAFCVGSALIPVMNAELYLLSAAAIAPSGFAIPLAIAATLGQMVGKIAMYYAGQGALRLPWERVQRGLAAAQARLEERPGMGKLLYFCSATTGLPPYYAMAIAAGAVRMNLAFFLVAGAVGRFLRFALVALLPEYAKTVLG